MRHVIHGAFVGQLVLIDEISFMSIDLLAALEHLRLKGVRLICFGDFGQLPPVVFLSREKPTVRHALVRITLFQPIALTLSRFIFRLLT